MASKRFRRNFAEISTKAIAEVQTGEKLLRVKALIMSLRTGPMNTHELVNVITSAYQLTH